MNKNILSYYNVLWSWHLQLPAVPPVYFKTKWKKKNLMLKTEFELGPVAFLVCEKLPPHNWDEEDHNPLVEEVSQILDIGKV